MVYSRASEPRPRTSSKLSSCTSRPCTPVTRARSTGIRRGGRAPASWRAEKRANGLDLVRAGCPSGTCPGASGDRLHRELLEQVRLQRSDADDEEGAEADGQQHDARLVARTATGAARRGAAETTATWRAGRMAGSSRGRPGAAPAPWRQSPAHTIRPTRQRAGLPGRERRRAPAATARWRRAAPVDAARTRPRRAAGSDGLTCRTSSSGTIENSSETSTPIPSPCSAAGAVRPYDDATRRGGRRRQRGGDGRDGARGQRHAEQAAGQAEHHHLQQVDGEDLRRARADALQDGDAADLLQDEHARHARHGDAAENHDDQARPGSGSSPPGRSSRRSRPRWPGRSARATNSFAKVGAQRGDERVERGLRDLQQQRCVRGAAAERQQPGARQVGEVDDHARPEAEVADPAAGLGRDDAANREALGPDEEAVADRHAELRRAARAAPARPGPRSRACE